MSTTRMGTDPKTSVTDSNCRVHGYSNLFIAGSSLFTTGGYQNPTMTIVALAARSETIWGTRNDPTASDFPVGTVSFCIGGALTAATGLGYYYLQQERQAVPSQVRESGGEEWVLTEADYQEMAVRNALPKSQTLELLDNVDIPGAGDLRAEKVSGISECVASCEADEDCNAFTFARMSHPLKDKRHMCWIKSERNPERLVSDFYYISGRKRKLRAVVR